ncbi:MAG: hypothetical protein K9M99_08865 [Candidatus Cloacimonetes bacterium]|nr:hypothetical protein [Candidatus Cloacimonadota bacterium]
MKLRIILLILLLMLTTELFCDDFPATGFWGNSIAGAGIGYGYQLYLANVTDSTYTGYRIFALGDMDDEDDRHLPPALEISWLLGKPIHYNCAFKRFIAYSTGLSYIYYPSQADNSKHHTLGIPLEVNMVRGINNYFGYGINLALNYNFSATYINLHFCLYAGDFKNRDYKPEGSDSITSWVIDNYYPEFKSKQTIRDSGRALVMQFNLLDNYLRKVYSQTHRRNSYRGVAGIRVENLGFLLAFNYLDCNDNRYKFHYDKIIFAGIKTRFHTSEKGIYFDLGILQYRFHERKDEFVDENWGSNYCLSFGCGNKIHLTKNITVCNQMNLDIKLSGENIENFNFLEDVPDYISIYMEFFVPGLELLF